MLSITKVFRFEAAHYLEGEGYGLCQNVHGHSYKLEITVSGLLQDDHMVMNFSELKKIVKQHIIDRLDHQLINEVLEYKHPTAEWLVSYFVEMLKEHLPDTVQLAKVRLWETPNSSAQWGIS